MTWRELVMTTKSGLSGQISPHRRQEEYSYIDREADVPKDCSQRRAVAQIGQDICNAHDHKQYGEFIDEILRRRPKFREQDGDGEERKGFDPVEVRAKRTRAE